MRLVLASVTALAAVAVTMCVTPAFAQLPMTGTHVPELQGVDTLLQNFFVNKPIPGGTVAITHNDKVVYELGFGYSDANRTIPMQENALMRLASVSKPVTASAIHQLVKDGQLSLNTKAFNISDNGGILNIAPYNGVLGDSRLRDITIGHLLEHKGGWNRDTAGDLAFRDVQIASQLGVPSPPGIANSARYILSQPLQVTPGTASYYSNIGYMFLGMVVEAVSGQSYDNYVDNHVLAPVGIPSWEISTGRTFAANQNPREPVYSSPNNARNVYDPNGSFVNSPYGGWDHEKAQAYGGLIGSSKAIAMMAQNRIANGPEIGKLRSDYTTFPTYWWYHTGSLDGTDTLMLQASWKDWTYSILFDRRPADGSSYTDSLVNAMQNLLQGIVAWPNALQYAGDFTEDQWLTADDINLFKSARELGSELAFDQLYPGARYLAGDFDGNGVVTGLDVPGMVGALQHAGVPAEYIGLMADLPGDFNEDNFVDSADYVLWRKNIGSSVYLPNETVSFGLVDQADYDVWRANFGTSLIPGSGSMQPSAEPLSSAVPEPATWVLLISLLTVGCKKTIAPGAIAVRGNLNYTLREVPRPLL
ncbi:MAG TPA: serine hydrolase [Lacipirellulaceae bacterium]|jgi:CubicO group peptidase (beta-lactamase class C family)|nr:serine hydrolase [Lacipirellulaceae bacterium]